MSDDAKRHREHTDYPDEQVGRAIVVQLVFEQGDFCVEEDRVWSGEFDEWDGVCGVVRVGVCPVGCVVGMVSGVGRRVRPVVWLGCDGGGQRQARAWVCAGGTLRATHVSTPRGLTGSSTRRPHSRP
jgi:hypothetical protein